jgi:hypothetical protein
VSLSRVIWDRRELGVRGTIGRLKVTLGST